MTRERSSRRADWTPGRPFRLPGDAEGSAWELPLPVLDLGIDADPEREDNRHFGRAYQGKQDELVAWLRTGPDEVTGDPLRFAGAALSLVSDLVGRNYAVPPDELLDLLPVLPGDGANDQLWGDLARHALGIGPRTARRWYRLAVLSRAGASGAVYQEDARDLGLILAMPAFEVIDGRLIPLPAFPSQAEWATDDQPAEEPDPNRMSSAEAYFWGPL